jgi:hypothetical protein
MNNIQQEEVDKNWEAFQATLPSIIGQYRDKYALMKNQEILGYYSSPQDAKSAADSFIPDGVYSIQQVTEIAANMGFFNYAIPVNTLQS